jgi:transcription initiation factor TFIIB
MSASSGHRDNDCISGKSHEIYLDRNSGEIICTNCGLVLQNHMIDPDWSLPRSDSKFGQSGTPTIEFEGAIPISQRTTLNTRQSDVIPVALKRAIRWNKSRTWTERRQLIGILAIRSVCDTIGLGENIRTQSNVLYQKIMKCAEFRNQSLELLGGVAVFYTARVQQVPLSLAEIFPSMKFSENLAYKIYYKMLHVLKLPRPAVNPCLYIPQFGQELDLPQHIISFAMKIVSHYNSVLENRSLSPKGLAVAGLYYACRVLKVARSQYLVAKLGDITESTLRSRIKDLERFIRRQEHQIEFDSLPVDQPAFI